jgi:hypothetical protein
VSERENQRGPKERRMKGSASAPSSRSITYSDRRLALRRDSCTASTSNAIITSGGGQSDQADVVVVKRRNAKIRGTCLLGIKSPEAVSSLSVSFTRYVNVFHPLPMQHATSRDRICGWLGEVCGQRVCLPRAPPTGSPWCQRKAHSTKHCS